MRRQRTAPWIRRFGEWVVTTYGIEYLWWYYPLSWKAIRASMESEIPIPKMARHEGETGDYWNLDRAYEYATSLIKEKQVTTVIAATRSREKARKQGA